MVKWSSHAFNGMFCPSMPAWTPRSLTMSKALTKRWGMVHHHPLAAFGTSKRRVSPPKLTFRMAATFLFTSASSNSGMRWQQKTKKSSTFGSLCTISGLLTFAISLQKFMKFTEKSKTSHHVLKIVIKIMVNRFNHILRLN